jgi:2-keto-4-pentenoate hydratase
MARIRSAITLEAAKLLRTAEKTGEFARPLREKYQDLSVDEAYAIQRYNVQRKLNEGYRIVGSKIGLTSPAAQKQLDVDQPDYGVLFAEMEFPEGLPIPLSRLQQPKLESEIAFIRGKDLNISQLTVVNVIRAVEYLAPALEIVGSRISDWNIKLVDTIADNATSSAYVLGSPLRRIDGFDFPKMCHDSDSC